MKQRNGIFVLYGPTAVGKTECAAALADMVPIEIVNGDVGQLYEPLSIGTAKPDWRSSKIPHHMFDVLTVPVDYTVVSYRQELKKITSEIWRRGNIPVIVGGSGFYIQSLFFPPHDYTCNITEIPQESTWEQLYKIDPERASEIDRHDTYRIKRALMVWHGTGQKPSVYAPVFDPVCPILMICLTRRRQELYTRINTRVTAMIEAGWLDEVVALQGTAWEQFLMRKKLIGYNELLAYRYSTDMMSFDIVINDIQKRTRQYAKRQSTFWNMLTRKLRYTQHQSGELCMITTEEHNLTSIDLDVYMKNLQHTITRFFYE